jgi:hypothetical protein
MSKRSIVISAILFTYSMISTSCAGSPPSNQVAPTETPLVEPTIAPTPQPQPTATPARLESGYLTLTNDGLIPVFQDELAPFFLPEDMVGGDMDNFQLIQNGYFASYDSATSILSMNARVMVANMYRPLNFQLNQGQKVSCLPETVGDTPIADLSYMISNGKVSFPPGPGEKSFDEILPYLTDASYLVVVLSEIVQPDQPNPATSVAAICP